MTINELFPINEEGGIIKDAYINFDEFKSKLIIFILYQLTSFEDEFGYGAGIFDPNGILDDSIIHHKMNEYLIGTCFTPRSGDSEKEYIHFLNYVLMNLSANGHDGEYHIDVGSLTKVMDQKLLFDYWERHRGKIIEVLEANPNMQVRTAAYVVIYQEYKDEIIIEFDKIIEMSFSRKEKIQP